MTQSERDGSVTAHRETENGSVRTVADSVAFDRPDQRPGHEALDGKATMRVIGPFGVLAHGAVAIGGGQDERSLQRARGFVQEGRDAVVRKVERRPRQSVQEIQNWYGRVGGSHPWRAI